MQRWIDSCALDLVHCHLPLSAVVGRLAARRGNVPVVYTEYNLQERYRWQTRWLNRVTWRMQDRVIAVSEGVAISIGKHLPDSVPVSVVRNGIPELPFTAKSYDAPSRFRSSVGLATAPVVGTIAVFRAQKRLDLWLQAAKEIANDVPEARFVIVGDGPSRGELEAAVAAANLQDRVLMPGLQSNIVDWLSCMDVFMMTSEFEGLPLALLEAMMTGTPVVGTAVGGIPEVIEDGDNGFLVPFGETERLAERAVELL